MQISLIEKKSCLKLPEVTMLSSYSKRTGDLFLVLVHGSITTKLLQSGHKI